MSLSVSKLRANLYRIVDQVIHTGQGVDIERRGRLVRIVAANPDDPLARLQPHPDYLAVDSEDLVHVDWSSEWRP